MNKMMEQMLEEFKASLQKKADAVNTLMNPMSKSSLNEWVYVFETVVASLKKHPAYDERFVNAIKSVYSCISVSSNLSDVMEALKKQKEGGSYESSEDNL